jgi:hypothetical protein
MPGATTIATVAAEVTAAPLRKALRFTSVMTPWLVQAMAGSPQQRPDRVGRITYDASPPAGLYWAGTTAGYENSLAGRR